MKKKEPYQGTKSLYLFSCHGTLSSPLAFQHESGEWQAVTEEPTRGRWFRKWINSVPNVEFWWKFISFPLKRFWASSQRTELLCGLWASSRSGRNWVLELLDSIWIYWVSLDRCSTVCVLCLLSNCAHCGCQVKIHLQISLLHAFDVSVF
jgi:hypothetical protein